MLKQKLFLYIMLSKSNALIFISISFALGVLLASAFEIPKMAVFAGALFSLALFLTAFLNKKYFGAQAALFLIVLVLGAWRLQAAQSENQFAPVLESKRLYEGLVIEEPDVRDNRQLITFRPDGFSQNILLTTTKAQSFFYGDRLAVEGKVTSAKEFDDFDYPKYLERFNVYALEKYPKILILKSNRGNGLKYFLLNVKAAFTERINSLFSEPQGSLLLGVLIGARKTLPQNVVDNFNKTGVSHIIAVSGFNITIIISALMGLSRFFGRRASFWISAALIFSFAIIAGASASVLRATIMGVLLLTSLNIGRQYSIVPALFFAGLVMLAANPKILFWDVGFQLSFAATLGIVFFVPLFLKRSESLGGLLGVRQLLITTFSAILATLPLMLLHFGQMSLVAPLVNLLILPAVPFIMLFGFLSILPLVGTGFAYVANILLIYALKITQTFATFKMASLEVHLTIVSFWAAIGLIFLAYFFLKDGKMNNGVDENRPL